MNILVIGAGGHARVIVDLLALRSHTIVGLLDDTPSLAGTAVYGLPVLGPLALLNQVVVSRNVTHVALAIGDNAARRRIAGSISALGLQLPVLIHPAASVSPRASVGDGSLICAGAVVGPGTRIGVGGIINTRASVDHDCLLADFVHIGPGATLAGEVQVGGESFIGAGATVIPRIKIGNNCIVGAGATVLHDVPDGLTVVGCPAKPIRSKS